MNHMSLIGILVVSALVCILGILSLYRRQHSLKRISELAGRTRSEEGIDQRERRGWIRRWLLLAGFRHSSASLVFLSSMVLSTWTALIVLLTLNYFELTDALSQSFSTVPGKIGAGLVILGHGVPWVIFCMIGASPIFVIRSMRQIRITDVEHDLPLFLDLLSTLAEAGMSFDVALGKILNSQPASRPLTKEFRIFQREVSLGISRIKCFRRLAQRIAVPSVGLLVSALIQSEQLGANVAHTLRRQANDLRHRRQEQAMLHAQGLSVKLVFPLVICFLPGIFLATLGPTVYHLVQILGSVSVSF